VLQGYCCFCQAQAGQPWHRLLPCWPDLLPLLLLLLLLLLLAS
jgi:hypothetical protein